MLILRGASALSDFRQRKLVARLAQALGFEVSLTSEYVHFVETSQSLDAGETRVLEKLLQYGPKAGAEARASDSSGTLILTVPRPGTISPWSSKSTDIAHNCGLEKIERIERGIRQGKPPSFLLTHAND